MIMLKGIKTCCEAGFLFDFHMYIAVFLVPIVNIPISVLKRSIYTQSYWY